jgi:hypothetical protein
MRATYTNTATNEAYTLGGICNLEQAWKLVNFAADRNGWDAADVFVTLK